MDIYEEKKSLHNHFGQGKSKEQGRCLKTMNCIHHLLLLLGVRIAHIKPVENKIDKII